MNILSLIKREKVKKEYFLALLLRTNELGSILFEEHSSKLTIIASMEKAEEKKVSEMESDELVKEADIVISGVEETLPEKESLSKVIFSVPQAWVEEGKIKAEFLAKLKVVCDELELTPVGFIISIEAILHYLQEKEGAPITSIFVEISKETVLVYIARAGNIIETIQGEIKEEGVAKSVESLLKKVQTLEVLPSKIIILDYENAKEIQQEFLTHHWTKELPFLHLPQVVILEKGFENEALINGVASQMGFGILEGQRTEEKLEPKENQFPDEVVVNEEVSQDLGLDDQVVETENFGFFKEKDIAVMEEEEKQIEEEHHEIEPAITHQETQEVEYAVDVPEQKKSFISKLIPNFAFGSISNKLNPGNLKFRGGLVLLPVLLILFLIVFSAIYYYFILNASVLLYIDKKNFDKKTDVTFSADKETSYSDKIIKLTTSEKEVEGKAEKDTTGIKETGEKAKGEITVYNKTDSPKTFSKGTVVVSPNNLQLEFTDDVNIASTSAFSTSLSSVKAKIVATKFGQEYNLPSGTNFTFKDFPSSSYFAKNEVAFSGGTKKSINVVSQKDMDNLAASLADDLKGKALPEKPSGDDVALNIPISYDFSEKKFDKKEGDESKKFSLSAKLKYKIGFYKKSDLENFAKDLTKNEAPKEYVFRPQDSKIELKNLEINKDETASAVLQGSISYSPAINTEDFKTKIKGNNSASLDKQIKELQGIGDYKVVYSNKIPIFPDIMPFNLKNINIDIRSNE